MFAPSAIVAVCHWYFIGYKTVSLKVYLVGKNDCVCDNNITFRVYGRDLRGYPCFILSQ